MKIELLHTLEDFRRIGEDFNRLPLPSPMQSFEWLAAWWDCYRDDRRELFVAAVFDGDRLVGLAPWYRESIRGRYRLRWLGDGQVCSDHVTLVAAEGYGQRVSRALAQWLLEQPRDAWQQLELDSVDADDANTQYLAAHLTSHGCLLNERAEAGSCYIALPDTWEEYLGRLSKSRRKRCRRWEKDYFATGRARVEVAQTPEECLANWQLLVGLHNSRRLSCGEEGAFENEQFAEFHRSVVPHLAEQNLLQLRVLYVDDQPMAVEYVLQQPGAWYAYQSGLSAAGEAVSAGGLSMIALVRSAIDSGCTRLDLLRGTEPYKYSWNVTHLPARTITLRRPTAAARVAALCDAALVRAKHAKQKLIPCD